MTKLQSIECSESARVPTVAIIGGGFSGTMLAAHLLRGASMPLRVLLIEHRAMLGRGLAYSTHDPVHLLNVPCGRMGATPDDVGGFYNWAKVHLSDSGPDAFLPRTDFGRYIEDQLLSAQRDKAAAVVFERITSKVDRLIPTADGAKIACADGTALHAHQVVLAMGSGPPRVPEPVRILSEHSDRLITTPFAENALRVVRPSERVLVLGTGLTMFDVALALESHGFTGSITAISRRGRSPKAHQPHQAAPWISEWARTLLTHQTARKLVHGVREAVQRAEADGSDWRAVIDAMRPHLTSIWQTMPLDERRRFLRHVAPFWEVKRHRCAPQIAESIEALRAQERLRVIAGRIETCCMDDGEIVAQIRPRGSKAVEEHRFDRVLVCAGPESDVTRWPSSLMQSLLTADLLTPDPLCMGVLSDPDAHPLTSNGIATPWLWVIGPLRKPDLWETTAVPELRVQAAAVARSVLEVFQPTQPDTVCQR